MVMRGFLRVGGVILFTAMVAVVVIYLVFEPRMRPASTEPVASSPERIERGRYLFNTVLGCSICHSERNDSIFGAPPVPPIGAGRVCVAAGVAVAGLDEEQGFPGTVCFRNITSDPTGTGDWSDGELMRAIREGVNRDGKAMFPTMPYFLYRNLSDADAKSIVTFLRELAPVMHSQPPADIDFPVDFFIKMMPEPLPEPVPHPDTSDTVAYGKYLAMVARCGFCHTPRDPRSRRPLEGLDYTGGAKFLSYGGTVAYSPNLTPHPDGLGDMSRAEFIELFIRHRQPVQVAPEDNSLMPWANYAWMRAQDLGAIYDFLQSLPAVPMSVRDGDGDVRLD